MSYELFKHQAESAAFYAANPRVFDMSDPGTGKTLVNIHAIKETGDRTIVFAPKSITQAAWGDDLEKFAPEVPYCVVSANNRHRVKHRDAQVVITNHDAAKWYFEDFGTDGFNRVIYDESTAFNN